MLTPSKHLDLEKSVIRVASEVIADLRRNRIMPYEAVVRLIKRRTFLSPYAVCVIRLSRSKSA